MSKEKKIKKLIDAIMTQELQLSAKEGALQPEIHIDAGSIYVVILTGFPSILLQKRLLPLLRTALEQYFPKYSIRVELSFFVKPHRTQMPGKGLRGVKNCIAVASGKGGVGKSTVAINLAAALAKMGARVGILDADIYGPSLPLMLGNESIEVHGDFYRPAHLHGLQAMSIGYLTSVQQALIWRGPMLAKSLLEMLNKTLWEEVDYLIIDLPPGTGDIQLSLVQKIPLAGAIVITTPQPVATLDAQKAIQLFEKTGISVLGLVENMSWYQCDHCDHRSQIFGNGGGQALSAQFNIPLLSQLPLNNNIRACCDSGTPAALEDQFLWEYFEQLALRTAIELAKKPLNYTDKFPNSILE